MVDNLSELQEVIVTRPKKTPKKAKTKVKRLQAPKNLGSPKKDKNKCKPKKKTKRPRDNKFPKDVPCENGNLFGNKWGIKWRDVIFIIQLKFLQTRNGFLKLLELPMAYLFCVYLINIIYSYKLHVNMHISLVLPLASATAIFVTILLITYSLSSKTQNALTKSLFDPLFNIIICFSYLSALGGLIHKTKSHQTSTVALFMNKEDFWVANHMHYGILAAAVLHGVDFLLGISYLLNDKICNNK